MTTPYSHDDMLTRAHVAIFGSTHWCWLTQVVLLGKRALVDSLQLKLPGGTVEVTALPTAATDGYSVWYSKTFLDKAWQLGQDKAVRMLVLHENLHKAMRHHTTWRHLFELDPKRTNYAADVVVNNLLLETPDFCANPSLLGGVVRPEWANKSVGEVYRLLEDDKQYQQQQGNGPGPDGDFDMHLQGGAIDESGEEISDAEMDLQLQAAVNQGLYMQRGKDPLGAERMAKMLEPQVNWREALATWLQGRTFGHDLADWKRPSRRSGALGVFLPKHYSERTGGLGIFGDTSGSIDGHTIGQWLGELSSLCTSLNPQFADVGWWDTNLHNVTRFEGDYTDIAQQTKVAGGGGTCLHSVLEHVRTAKEPYRGVVILTDGYVDGFFEGQWPCDVFVVLNTDVACPLPHARIQ